MSPATQPGSADSSTAALLARYRWHALRRSLSNFALLRHRHCAGFLASMHQSGTHWLKFMLANALAARHGLPPPQYNHANDFIGGPRDPHVHARLPHLVSSHSIPHPLMCVAPLHRRLRLPPYVILVRDLRASLVSNYEKWRDRYGVTFPEYLRGDPGGRRYNSDLWWCLRFLNGWGVFAARTPATTLVVRYEDMQADPGAVLARVGVFLALDLGAAHVAAAVAASTKERMRARHDPGRPQGEIRADRRDLAHWFGPAEERFVRDVCQRLLRYRYGYDYER
ncbi:MAG: sulfotransferase domain-containing protein [Gammaproteobacteria bacterium]|nr:sulfotransferase domain-containing protein [Gammaproteobacteria bacterium]